MGDEIRNANIIRIYAANGCWRALIGPDEERGLVAHGKDPLHALVHLLDRIMLLGWPFDATYEPKPAPTFHDA